MLVLLLLACLVYPVVGFAPPQTIDFSPLHAAIKHALETSETTGIVKPLTNESTSLDCHMPNNAIMLTLSNFYSADLIALQRKSMQVWNMKECLESRFVTVCLDSQCINVCKKNSINNCVLLPINLPASDFLQGAYRFLSYLKHMVMFEALKFASEIFFFDADIVIFRNPWPDTLYKRFNDGSRNYSSGPMDMMWQREIGTKDMGCEGPVNGGQLYLRNSTMAQEFMKYMLSLKPLLLDERKKEYDQNYIAAQTKKLGMQTCCLSPQLFTTHCWDPDHSVLSLKPMSELISYHGACMGTLGRKVAALTKVYEGVAANNSKNVLRDFMTATH